MNWGIIQKPFVNVPWTTPPIIGHYLVTGGDWKAAVWGAISIVIAMLVLSVCQSRRTPAIESRGGRDGARITAPNTLFSSVAVVGVLATQRRHCKQLIFWAHFELSRPGDAVMLRQH